MLGTTGLFARGLGTPTNGGAGLFARGFTTNTGVEPATLGDPPHAATFEVVVSAATIEF